MELEKQAGILRLEMVGESKVSIFHDDLHEWDVMRMIAQCEAEMENDDAFVVVNLTTLAKRFKEFKDKMPRVEPFYAIKCNSDPMMVHLIADMGGGFDCASKQEMDLVVGSGLVPPHKVIYANPIKQRSFVEHAAKLGVRRMTFDNVEELEKIKDLHPNPELVLRIRVDDPSAATNLGIKFGADPPMEKGEELLHQAAEMDLPVIGVSFHIGSDSEDATTYTKAISICRKLFNVGKSLGHQMRFLDLGGGFPGCDNKKNSLDQCADAINKGLEEDFPVGEFPPDKLQIVAEPGRYFAMTPVSLVTHIIGATRVPASRITKKDSDSNKDGYMYYMNDGVHGSFGAVIYSDAHPTGTALLISRQPSQDERTYPSIVWGPTCTGQDEVEKMTMLRRLTIGDWLYYPHMGAYTTVTASHFNGFEFPRPYYIMDDSTWVEVYGEGEKKKLDGKERMSGDDLDVEHQIVKLFE